MPNTAIDSAAPSSAHAPQSRSARLAAQFSAVRRRSLALVDGLLPEDLVPQSMPDASPGQWHLAHTTWFFDALVLSRDGRTCTAPEGWQTLFNSYYEALGPRHPRPQRGLLTRPGLAAILDWRARIDDLVIDRLAQAPDPATLDRIELGCHHEQQHQELLVTDLKHLFAANPLGPAWRQPAPAPSAGDVPSLGWIAHAQAGPAPLGHAAASFAFDNESPAHTVWLAPFALADRPVTVAEYLGFIEDGGYADARLWLSDGWARVQAEDWQAPLYWQRHDGAWRQFTVWGWRDLDAAEAVVHVSQYEADAFARWAGARLPTEAEWETVARARRFDGSFADAGRLHPSPLDGPRFGGEVWEWTASAYLAYPGFRPAAGAIGEYNGKFMSGQAVLRGGSCATPRDHVRATYRNFFPPSARWQFSGIRLARDLAD